MCDQVRYSSYCICNHKSDSDFTSRDFYTGMVSWGEGETQSQNYTATCVIMYDIVVTTKKVFHKQAEFLMLG